jgi:hypothetical protein
MGSDNCQRTLGPQVSPLVGSDCGDRDMELSWVSC